MKNNDSYVEKEVKRAARFAKSEMKEVRGILGRIKRRDLKGNSGQAIKNTSYTLTTNIVAKIGALIFTVVIARMLQPELFGLYSLALSTIIFFVAFSDLGIGNALIKYLSKEISKNNNKGVGKYFHFLLKIKIYVVSIVCLVLGFSAYFISINYYNKPEIFYALLAGIIYIVAAGILQFFSTVLQSYNNFRPYLYKEIILQTSRLILVPLAIILFIGYAEEVTIFFVIFSLSLSYLIAAIYITIKTPKIKKESISKNEKKNVIKFILPLSATVLSGVFFGYIDMIILGRFVAGEFIGYYQAAAIWIGSLGGFTSFIAAAVFPIFSRLDKKGLNLFLKKIIRKLFVVSFISFLFTFIFANIIIILIYDAPYAPSINILRILSLSLLLDPVIGMYTIYHITRGHTSLVAKSMIISSVINIIFNLIIIALLTGSVPIMLVSGVAWVTVFSKLINFLILYGGKNERG
jgi:O-antigen/teichoic acid export membrane protein